jgi:glutamate-ammonia-ligase adenylyltransferase
VQRIRAVLERLTTSWRDPAARRAALEPLPPPWRDAMASLVAGPDPERALLNAVGLPDAALERPLSRRLCRLLHHGGYAARMLALDPKAVLQLEDAWRPRPPHALDRLTRRELARLRGQGHDAAMAIALTRTRAMLWLMAREIEGAPLEEVGRGLSGLVAACCDVALESLGLAQEVCVLGMGKLGGGELNVFSDVDLVFVHDDALDEGPNAFNAKLRLFEGLRKLIRLLEGTGAFRPLFRVDMRLRPFGSQGALSLSVSSTEAYFEAHGRDWERQAWLRAAPIAGRVDLGEALLERLVPFSYRRAVSPAIFAEIAALMARARAQARRGLGERAAPDALAGAGVDVKLDRGGIREVEFFAQAMQLLHGGRNPELRTRSCISALDRLAVAGLVSDREHATLTAAYRFFRRIEHALQLAEGAQTHTIPEDPAALARLVARLEGARADLGFDEEIAVQRFLAELDVHRRRVVTIARTLLGEADTQTSPDEDRRARAQAAILDPMVSLGELRAAMAELDARDPAEIADLWLSIRDRAGSPFTTDGEARVGAERLLLACLDSADPDGALARFAEFAALRPAHFGAWRFLARDDQRDVVRLVADVFGTGEALAKGLVGFPNARGVADDESLSMLVEARGGRLADAQGLARLLVSDEPELLPAPVDDETSPSAPRPPPARLPTHEIDRRLLHFKHRELVRIALADLSRRPDPFLVGRSLSDLGDVVVQVVIADLAARFAEEDTSGASFELAILGLGKLGMQAMDYGSDLDLVFVYEPRSAPDASREAAVRVARRLIQRLEDRSRGVRLYEVDVRLRPSGRQGMLVTSLDGFRSYHGGTLPTWERLAQLRARAITEVRFERGVTPTADRADPLAPVAPGRLAATIVEEILPASCYPPDPAAYTQLGADVRALKARIEREIARETRDQLDVKAGAGGCLEIELLLSTLQLSAGTGIGRSARIGPPSAALRARNVMDATRPLVAAGLLHAEDAEDLVDAYRFQRLLLNRLRMRHGAGGVDEGDRLSLHSPRLAPLARRMGLVDGAALVQALLDHRARVRTAFDRYTSPK